MLMPKRSSEEAQKPKSSQKQYWASSLHAETQPRLKPASSCPTKALGQSLKPKPSSSPAKSKTWAQNRKTLVKKLANAQTSIFSEGSIDKYLRLDLTIS